MKDDKAAALALFLAGWDQNDIAKIVGVTERTMTKWATDGKWKEMRTEQALFERSSSDQVQDLITYQLKVLNRIRAKQEQLLEDDGEEMDISTLNGMLIQNGQLDGLQKLFNAIKSKELAWEDYITVVREYTEFLHAQGFPHMEELEPYASDFIKTTRAKA